MFDGCSSLEKLNDIFKWNTSKVNNMSYMFNKCSSIRYMNITDWNVENVTDMSCMFNECSSLRYLTGSQERKLKWKLNKNLICKDMFKNVDKEVIPKQFKHCLIF